MRFTSDKKALVAVTLAFSVLVALGCWQVKRLEWKLHLISETEERLARPPVTMPMKINYIANWQYRRVALYGTFAHKKEFLVGPRTLDGVAGHHLVTPLELPAGITVMVNRGFVDDGHLAAVSRPTGFVNVPAVLMMPQKSAFTPDNDVAKHDWYWIDPAAMAEAASLGKVSPLIAVAEPKEGAAAWPKAMPTHPEIRNEHKKYAIFWFTMAFILLAFYIVWQRSLNRERQHAGL